MKIAIAALAALIAVPILVGGAGQAVVSAVFGDSSGVNCVPEGAGSSTSVAGYGPAQLANAATIVAVGKQMRVPARGWVVAVATAMQESTLRNLDHGDRDSLGLFQQRPSQGWGTAEQITNPTYAATQFYQHLLAVPAWQQMSLDQAAQTVQSSGTPTAYSQHEQDANQVIAAVQGATCATVGTGDCNNIQAPNPTAALALTYSCNQIGLPYVWGGNGPASGDAGFDCSGLTKAAYDSSGISLPRTAQTQYNAGPLVPAGQPLLPGDLVFYGTAGKVHHVGLYIGAGKMINAPTFNVPIEVANVHWDGDDYLGASRPSVDSRVGSRP
ncbi:C40 family peptidase [Amycolatopsis sp.]|uniref:C40 family peptidase n=1 Tax=Amycolatopsis sp. TaxID=37632 RepID=UPI002BF712B3|nr:C40 family peptidase [Amycolatopsis sp.]HVV12126.1 C40 family peptidase [Amycolatopsis sp.]